MTPETALAALGNLVVHVPSGMAAIAAVEYNYAAGDAGGRASSPSAARGPTASTSCRRRRPAARRWSSRSSRRRPESDVPWLVADARLALALLGAAVAGASEPRNPRRRRHRHQRQDLDHLLRGRGARRRRARSGGSGPSHYKSRRPRQRPAAQTTPEALDVQPLLRRWSPAGNHSCVMEVSSHALALRRVAGVAVRRGGCSPICRRDHLDFHRAMQSSYAAKRRLFEEVGRRQSAPAWSTRRRRRRRLIVAACRPAGHLRHPSARPRRGRATLTMTLPGVPSPRRRRAARCASASPLVGAPTSTTCSRPGGRRWPSGCRPDAIARRAAALRGVPGRLRGGLDAARRLHGRRRLRPHRRRAEQRAGGAAGAAAAPPHHRLRLRRRPRRDQAPARWPKPSSS